MNYSIAKIKEEFEGKLVKSSRSPAGNWLEMKLLHLEHGIAKLSIAVKHDMTNPYGNIHGGMMALLIDEAIGWAVISLEAASHYTSLNLSLDFLYAAKEGEEVVVIAKIIRQGKKIIHAEASVYNTENILLAKATSNLVATTMKIKN